MSIHLIIDKAGRVVIPKPLREQLHLEAGDTLELESAGEQITLRPVRGTGPLTKEHGVLGYRAGQPLPAIRYGRDASEDPGRPGQGKSCPGRMKAFFDTSVLVPVFYGDHIHHKASLELFIRFDKTTGCCGACLAGVYSTLTRMPGKHRISGGTKAMLFVGSIQRTAFPCCA